MFEELNENLEAYSAEPIIEEDTEQSDEFEETVEDVCDDLYRPFLSSNACYIIGGNLNLRKEASKNSSIVKVLPLGLVLEVKEKGDTWSRVSDGSDEGWVMTEFLQFEE